MINLIWIGGFLVASLVVGICLFYINSKRMEIVDDLENSGSISDSLLVDLCVANIDSDKSASEKFAEDERLIGLMRLSSERRKQRGKLKSSSEKFLF